MEAKLQVETPSRIFAKGVRNLDKAVINILPIEANVKRRLCQAINLRYPTIPQNMDSLQIENKWTTNGDGNNFLSTIIKVKTV